MAEAAMEQAERVVTDGEAFEARLQACGLSEAEAPRDVLIAPWGEVSSARGNFVMDETGAAAVVSAFAAHGTDLPIDYEHQSLGGEYAARDGLAPAAGWIRGLHAVAPGSESQTRDQPGLWAEVEWTGPARERLAAREYRFLSPVVMVRKSDRRVVALHSAALTNKPAIAGMRAIVNGGSDASGIDSGTPVEISSAADGLARLSTQLGLPADTDESAVLIAATERIEHMRAESAEREAAERVARAASAGKLPAGLRDWAMRLALRDPACFDEWLANASVLVVGGRTTAPPVTSGGRDQVAVAASARAAYRAETAIAKVTSEEAWVAQALREAGIESGKT